MSEPRTPGDDATPPTPESAEEPAPESAEEPAAESASAAPDSAPGGDVPAEAWPELVPSAGPAPSATSWGSPSQLSSTPPPAASPGPESPFEPAEPLPDTRLGTVGDASAGDGAAAASPTVTRRSPIGLRWGLAVVGILIVVVASALIVSLASGRPATSIALGYMPAN
ncbi:MAG TPA: hypothetical protein VNM34_01650, partial [Verrucomicrobiae bacterium]|nr:hypothetical protein [Verrucomicrobiae bacterium]